MNPRPSARRPARWSAPALIAAVAALTLPCAAARAGCGSHDSRPAISLDREAPAPVQPPAAPGRAPSCSGPSCSRDVPALPAVDEPAAGPRLDPLAPPTTGPTAVEGPGRLPERGERLSPIGRITDLERPPCPLA